MLRIGLILATAALALNAQAQQIDKAKVTIVGLNTELANTAYVLASPAGSSSECGFNIIRLPSITSEQGRALLSMALSAQATQVSANITYKVTAPQVCELTQLQLLAP
ncbi:hypothetical protein [Atopomonas sediminilitoris]|uniref:hypothetical protein n=1 Tax=Atopomonas sediminilitoris TaxID=2919919 RepID=UPI001F4E7EA3|nr:hypothetical protein [Atopomonas sediminilitoris]MCJ8169589.1 hypothetical protein [Atopomonas sediminilitoris]